MASSFLPLSAGRTAVVVAELLVLTIGACRRNGPEDRACVLLGQKCGRTVAAELSNCSEMTESALDDEQVKLLTECLVHAVDCPSAHRCVTDAVSRQIRELKK